MTPNTALAAVGTKQQLDPKERKEHLSISAAAPATASPSRQAVVVGVSVTPTQVQQRHSEQQLSKAPAHPQKQTSPCIRICLSFRPMTHFGRLASGGSNAPAYN